MNRLKQQYQQEVAPKLQKELKLSSPMAVPTITKIVLNMGVTEPQETGPREKALENIQEQFATITGQRPQITKAKKAISNFGLRAGDPVGVTVTLRGQKMWQFLDKLISVALPRVKDFKGVSLTAFDGQGNYSIGLEEQIIFPEINYDQIESVRSFQVNINTSTESNQQARRLLELLGMPFEKEEDK
ncbi:MAG: 50S ribosomal protein L5 [Candidatus Pacebacteria bacterium]|nr:50S ribosomal protein L5 [Candidatus Paceibacterota bacterium]